MGETISQNAKVIGEKAAVVAQVGCRMGSLMTVHDASGDCHVVYHGSSVHMDARCAHIARLLRMDVMPQGAVLNWPELSTDCCRPAAKPTLACCNSPCPVPSCSSYRPQSGLASLRSFYANVASSVEQAARQNGYNIDLGARQAAQAAQAAQAQAALQAQAQAAIQAQQGANGGYLGVGSGGGGYGGGGYEPVGSGSRDGGAASRGGASGRGGADGFSGFEAAGDDDGEAGFRMYRSLGGPERVGCTGSSGGKTEKHTCGFLQRVPAATYSGKSLRLYVKLLAILLNLRMFTASLDTAAALSPTCRLGRLGLEAPEHHIQAQHRKRRGRQQNAQVQKHASAAWQEGRGGGRVGQVVEAVVMAGCSRRGAAPCVLEFACGAGQGLRDRFIQQVRF